MGKWFKLPPILSTSGWRRTAIVNLVLTLALYTGLVGLLARSRALAGSADNYVFYQGTCAETRRLNLLLHVVINIVSTCIIASSNFFLQVLSSPTRQEVDKAHKRHYSLEIGVPSLQNVLHISRLKTALWLFLVLTSVPVHLLFNSAVFMSDYQGSVYFMAMGTEAFVNGHDYSPLGASLIHPMDDPRWGTATIDYSRILDKESDFSLHLSYLSTTARSWTRLDAHDCRAQYGWRSPRREYGDAVLVVDTQFQQPMIPQQSNPVGFVVEDIFNLTEAGAYWNPYNLSTGEVRAYWEKFGPVDQPNPLWFAAPCSIIALDYDGDCYHRCAAALGIRYDGLMTTMSRPYWHTNETITSWDISLASYEATPGDREEWQWGRTTIEERPTFNTTNIAPEARLSITHCYAQPLPSPCKIALSNSIFRVVIVAIGVKLLVALITCIFVRGNPLVTPGDAVASFIAHPDSTTENRAAVSKPRTFKNLRATWNSAPASQEWLDTGKPRISEGIPLLVWSRTYALVLSLLLCTLVFFRMAVKDTNYGSLSYDLSAYTPIMGRVLFKNVSLIGKVLLANTPQLALSLCYFTYNALFTRACAEMEWNSYATSYKPLRVSYPVKGQISTYRLQLPYRYSIPLLTISVLLHLLVSDALYVVIVDGDYIQRGTSELPGISDKVYLGLAFSPHGIRNVLLAGIAVALLPLGFILRLKGNMVICRNNSFIISAACHVSTWSVQPGPEAPTGSIGMQSLVDDSAVSANRDAESVPTTDEQNTRGEEREAEAARLIEDDDHESQALLKMASSRLRWGVVPMSPWWQSSFHEDRHEVEHLAFGTEDQDVKPPEAGLYYA